MAVTAKFKIGEKEYVLISAQEYRRTQLATHILKQVRKAKIPLEDIEDLAIIEERRNEPTLSLEQLKAELGMK